MTTNELLIKWQNDMRNAIAIAHGLGHLHRIVRERELMHAQDEFCAYARRLDNAIHLLEQITASTRSGRFPKIPTLDNLPTRLTRRIRDVVGDQIAVVAALPRITPDVVSIRIEPY